MMRRARVPAATTHRGRRLSRLSFLVTILAVPMMLRVFWTDEPRPLASESATVSSRQNQNHLDSSRWPHPWDAMTHPTATAAAAGGGNDRRCPGDASRNDGSMFRFDFHAHEYQYQYEAIRHREFRTRSIRALVATAVGLAIPVLVFLYAFLFRRNPDRTAGKKRQRRREKIREALSDCGMRLEPPESGDDGDDRGCGSECECECPICLEPLAPGEWVVASRHCRCGTASGGRTAAACAEQEQEHNPNNRRDVHGRRARTGSRSGTRTQTRTRTRTVFHEDCIVAWLSQKHTNPKQLCPCCRQPFLGPPKSKPPSRRSRRGVRSGNRTHPMGQNTT